MHTKIKKINKLVMCDTCCKILIPFIQNFNNYFTDDHVSKKIHNKVVHPIYRIVDRMKNIIEQQTRQ